MFSQRFVTGGRDNNMNLLRFIMALAVLVSHAWPICKGPGTPEPLQAATGYSLGSYAVFVFFALSGFLISESYAQKNAPGPYLVARTARLVPGLLVSLLLVAFVLGPVVSAAYLDAPQSWGFVAANLTLIHPQYSLPGVFAGNPYPQVEGSIWTLAHEAGWYLVVLACGLCGILRRPALVGLLAGLMALAYVGLQVAGLQYPGLHIAAKLAQFIQLGLPFALGMAFRSYKALIPNTLWIMAALALAAGVTLNTPYGFPLLMAFVVYATFWLAYGPGGALRAFNRVGDYSYGIYIYAFPLQGLIVWLLPGVGVAGNIALATPLTLGLAVLSWHLVEHPALIWVKARLPRRANRSIPADFAGISAS